MLVSSMTRRSQSSRFSALRLKPPFFGSVSSRRWMVFASMPVCSAMRLAARPVGAASRIFVPLAATIRRMASSSVVLPTPGPPVTTATFDRRTIAIAARCDGASVLPVFFSTHGMALSASIAGHGGAPRPNARSRSAMPRSARYSPRRKTQDRPSIVSAHDLAAVKLMGQRRFDDAGVDFEQRRRELDQVFSRQAAMALVGRLLQSEGNAGAHPLRRLPRHAELHGDGVGGPKPDAADVAREPVGILGHDLDGVVAVGLEDADRARRADAVGMQEEHDVADGLLLGPAGGDFRCAELADARDVPQLLGAGLDDFERRHAEDGDDPLRRALGRCRAPCRSRGISRSPRRSSAAWS